MKRKCIVGGGLALHCVVALFAVVMIPAPTKASSVLIEGWNNTSDATFDGWVTSLQPYTPSYSTTTAVTEGAACIAMTGTAGPTYGQMLRSASTTSMTSMLANASSISFDVTTDPASFGFFLQWDVDVNNADTGYQSLDGYSYQSVSIGGTTTLTVPVSPAIAATLASSANPTELIFQVGGGSSGNPQTFFLDNVRAVLVPEPASIGLIGLGGLIARRRRAK